jgi:spore coat polysaccharide biosynthesis protein SpsF
VTTGVFVYARADSERLPGKVLKDFGDGNLLGHVLSRAQNVFASVWCLLTSVREVDDPIANQANEFGFKVIRGSADNLVERTLQALDFHQVSHFVRVNADSPWFEPKIVNFALQDLSASLTTNLFERSFPYGVSVEILDADFYRRSAFRANAAELEHVTNHLYSPFFYSQTRSLVQTRDDSAIRLTVDTPEDYAAMCQISNLPGVHTHSSYWEFLDLEDPLLRLTREYR